jgi:hypothetical protein
MANPPLTPRRQCALFVNELLNTHYGTYAQIPRPGSLDVDTLVDRVRAKFTQEGIDQFLPLIDADER